VGVEFPARGPIAFEAWLELMGAFVRPSIVLSGTAGTDLFTAFPAWGSAGLGVRWGR
jgi:hypothetical protein